MLVKLLAEHKPRAVLNFAAESNVDRFINGPGDFIETNVLGTFKLLESVRAYWQDLLASDKESFRFLHVSTDEVYCTLRPTDPLFAETDLPPASFTKIIVVSLQILENCGYEDHTIYR